MERKQKKTDSLSNDVTGERLRTHRQRPSPSSPIQFKKYLYIKGKWVPRRVRHALVEEISKKRITVPNRDNLIGSCLPE